MLAYRCKRRALPVDFATIDGDCQSPHKRIRHRFCVCLRTHQFADQLMRRRRRYHQFDRRFLFQILAMGHSHGAVIALKTNTHVNCLCLDLLAGIAIAEDWIHGTCRRVIVVGADDVTNETMLKIGSASAGAPPPPNLKMQRDL